MSRSLRIVLTGGGSGGHVYPLAAVLEKLKEAASKQQVNIDFYYLGPKDEYAIILQKYGLIHKTVSGAKLRRYFSLQNLIDIPRFFLGLLGAWFKLFWIMPDVIFSKGGPGALQVIIAGWFYRIPIVIHESDASPGLTNLLSSFFAKRIGVGFERAKKYFNPKKVFLSGNPVRSELLGSPLASESAKTEFGFKPDQPIVLVLGGSQGSQRINEFIVVNLAELLKEAQVLHQTGKGNYEEIKKLAQTVLISLPLRTELESRYHAISYFEDNLRLAITAADLVVARAGAGTIFEIASFGKPSILIPLIEAANDHQRVNAFEFARGGGAIVIEENNLLPGIFLNQIKTILHNPDLANKMGEAAKSFSTPKASEVLAEEIVKATL